MTEFFSDYPWAAATLKVVGALVLIFLLRLVANPIITRVIRQAVRPDSQASKEAEKAREDTIISIVSRVIGLAIWFFGGLVVLSSFGVNIAPLIAGASILGLAVGFGSQAIVRDFISGIFIIMENQYRIGDWVTVAGHTGQVEAITVRQTIVRDAQGFRHHVPNGEVKISINRSVDFGLINLVVSVGYDANLDLVESVIERVGAELQSDSDWSQDIIEPPRMVGLVDLAESSVDIKVGGRVKPGRQWSVSCQLRQRLKAAFDREGIDIPFPHRVVRLLDSPSPPKIKKNQEPKS